MCRLKPIAEADSIVGHAARARRPGPRPIFFCPTQARPGTEASGPGLARPRAAGRAWALPQARGPARHGLLQSSRPASGPACQPRVATPPGQGRATFSPAPSHLSSPPASPSIPQSLTPNPKSYPLPLASRLFPARRRLPRLRPSPSRAQPSPSVRWPPSLLPSPLPCAGHPPSPFSGALASIPPSPSSGPLGSLLFHGGDGTWP